MLALVSTFSKWLEGDENSDRWYGHTMPFTAKERRILISHWTGEAYKELVGEKYQKFRWSQFEKTGCLITTDGSEDDKIAPEGLEDYTVPPPSVLDPVLEPPQGNVTVEADDLLEELDGFDVVGEEVEDGILKEDDVLEDNVEDRNEDHDLKGRKVEILYSNGWYTGDINYFNSNLNEYKVTFTDGTCDYVKFSDIDGIEVKLV